MSVLIKCPGFRGPRTDPPAGSRSRGGGNTLSAIDVVSVGVEVQWIRRHLLDMSRIYGDYPRTAAGKVVYPPSVRTACIAVQLVDWKQRVRSARPSFVKYDTMSQQSIKRHSQGIAVATAEK